MFLELKNENTTLIFIAQKVKSKKTVLADKYTQKTLIFDGDGGGEGQVIRSVS